MAFISANGVAEDEVGLTQWLLAARLAHSGPAAAMKVPALVVPPAPPAPAAPPSAPDMSAPPPPPPQAARVRPNKQAGNQENRGAQRRWVMARRKCESRCCMLVESRDGKKRCCRPGPALQGRSLGDGDGVVGVSPFMGWRWGRQAEQMRPLAGLPPGRTGRSPWRHRWARGATPCPVAGP